MSSVIELSKIFSEYDFVRLPNVIEHNRSILFDYIRLSSIINVFDYVRLPTPGVLHICLITKFVSTKTEILLSIQFR